MAYILNQYTGLLDYYEPAPSLSGYVPYTGATANVDLGSFFYKGAGLKDVSTVLSLDFNNRTLYNNTGSITLDWQNRQLKDASGVLMGTWGTWYLLQGEIGKYIAISGIDTSGGYAAIDVENQVLYDYAGTPSLDWTNRELKDQSSNASINYDTRVLVNPTGYNTVDWSGAYLTDPANVLSVDWAFRTLRDTAGNSVIDYYNASGVRLTPKLAITNTISLVPVSNLHIDNGTGVASDLRFTAGTTTGQTTSDGFQIGITTAGVAEIRQREAQTLQFFTSNVNYMSLTAGAPTLTLDSQASNSVNAGTIVYRTASGAESFTTTFNASDNNFYFLYGATTVGSVTSSGWGFGITAFDNLATVHVRATSEQLRLDNNGTAFTRFLQGTSGLNIYPAVNNTLGFTVSKSDGATYVLIVDSSNTRVGVGTTPAAVLHTLGTTEQLRVGYNSSNYLSVTTSSGGAITYDAVGTGTVYQSFLDKVGIGSGTPTAQLHVFATTEQLRLQYDGSNYFTTTVSSSGQVTWDAIGSNPKFVLSDPTDINAVFNVNYGGAGSLAAARVLLTADTSNVTTAVCLDTSSNGGIGRLTASSSIQKWMTSNVRVIQTSTAGYTISDVDVTETSTGSGVKLFAKWQIGSSSRFTLSTRAEQFNYYDASNYFSLTPGSTGIITINAVGSAASYVFQQASVTINSFSTRERVGFCRNPMTGTAGSTSLGNGYTPQTVGMSTGYTGGGTGWDATYIGIGLLVTTDATPTEIMVGQGGNETANKKRCCDLNNSTYAAGAFFELTIIAKELNTDTVSTFKRVGTIKRVSAGTVTLENSYTLGTDYNPSGLGGIGLAINTKALEVKVTGNGNDVAWSVKFEWQELAYESIA